MALRSISVEGDPAPGRRRGALRAGPEVPSAPRPDVLTIREVAAYLRIPLSTVYRLAERGAVPGHKVGRQWRFHRSILEEWFRRQAAATEATILVVDDAGDTRRAAVLAVQGSGHQLLTASAAEALRTADGTGVDLVVLDLGAPDAGAVEIFRQLRGRRPELPVVIVAGPGAADLVSAALEVGPFTLAQKPLEPDQLRKLVGRILGA